MIVTHRHEAMNNYPMEESTHKNIYTAAGSNFGSLNYKRDCTDESIRGVFGFNQ